MISRPSVVLMLRRKLFTAASVGDCRVLRGLAGLDFAEFFLVIADPVNYPRTKKSDFHFS